MISKSFKILFVFLLIQCFVGCKGGTIQIVHPEETITAVMTDLYIAAVAIKDVDTLFKDSLRVLYRDQIEQIHKINLEEVERDIEALQSDPEFYKRIHAAVEDSIIMIDKRMNSNKTGEKVFK